MLVLGGIAAAHVAAGKAQPQFDPGVAGLDAIFALALTGAGDFDLVEMVALAGHKTLLRLARSLRSASAGHQRTRRSGSSLSAISCAELLRPSGAPWKGRWRWPVCGS